MDFEAFWREYPRKIGRMKAERCWKKMGILRHQQCITGLRRWLNSLDWQDIQFIPYPATFLNQRRWEEEPSMPFTRSTRDIRMPTPEQTERDKREIAEVL